MLPNTHIKRIAYKELGLFFSSPIAYLFLGVFVAITLFIFFWVESFFTRNIADVRPMFEWMPILLILLSAALTMRMWSEERRTGTLEHLLTLPQSPWNFVLGKFAACKTLLVIALVLTLPLPISISLFADVDWGPIISAYIATIALGSAYIAIGLWVSARSDNQIVSLILTVLICSALYLIGHPVFTKLLSNHNADLLRSLSSGARFDSITRGVLDLRDFYYYISITLVFLVLNRYALEKERWAGNKSNAQHKRWHLFSALALANILLANFWLAPISALRIDTTEGKIYSISHASRNYIKQLNEPLTIRGYFSDKTHPLLAPLVPQLQDLIREYEQEGNGKINVEFIDPAKNPDAEEEAGNKYGIKPVPFRVADRYQSAVVNSYFNVLIEYGDEYKVLGFQEFIEVKPSPSGDIEVLLKNPEYNLTNAIKQTLYAYQSGGNLFDSLTQSVEFTAYVSAPNTLPEALAQFTPELSARLEQAAQDSNGKFNYNFIDPNADGGAVAQELAETYGFQPMASSFFDENTFYYYLVMSDGETAVQIPIPEELNIDGFNRGFDAGLKRFATGFLKTIGVSAPEQNPYAAQFGQPTGPSFNALQQMLNDNMSTKSVDLSKGFVDSDVDLLIVLAPASLTENALFAIDQFLMKGGTVVMATSPFNASLTRDSLTATPQDSGLDDWLAHHGFSIGKSFVMDAQNAAFPLPVTRQVGMFQVQEMQMLDYPYFVEVRGAGLNEDNPVTSALQQLTMPWPSPIEVNDEANAGRDLETLISSSALSWLSEDTAISPVSAEPFPRGEIIGPQKLAIAATGEFTSFFEGKGSPLLAAEQELQDDVDASDENAAEEPAPNEVISSVIRRSSDSARLLLISSNSFAEDQIAGVLSSIEGNNYAAPFEFLTNAVEWSLEDEGLLSIRSRGHFNRTLPPLDDSDKKQWEYINYGLSFLALFAVFLVRSLREKAKRGRYQLLLSQGASE
jgi:ABC-2 type transport system permease protein